MNRAQKRMMDKQLKKKLTTDQFEDLKSQVIEEKVREEVDRFIGNFVAVYLPAMRENKISEERANKIIEDVFSRARKRFDNGAKGDERPGYVEADTFEKVTAAFLKSKDIKDSEELAKGLYKEFMETTKGEAEV